AVALSLLLPPRYEAASAVLLRSAEGRSALSLGGMGALGGILPGVGQSGLETEIELLTSRTGIEAVIDSLFLQAQVIRPRSTGAVDLFVAARFDRDLTKAGYRFHRQADGGYR